MNRQDFRFFHPLRVRWVEVDMQKIVFNAHYLMYFDTAISDYWRALALPYEEAMHDLGGDLYVKKASVEYHGSARFDDRLDVALRCARVGNSSIQFTGAIFRGNDLLITAELIYVFADPATQTSKPVPEALRAIFTRFESGEGMTRLALGTWSELETDAAKVRSEVFLQEQKIPVDMEWDEMDGDAIHAVLYNGLGTPLGTGRLVTSSPGVGRIGRMAVKRVLRGSQLGCEILHALTAHSQERGDQEVMLHAQLSARNFYERAGFTDRGEPFEEAGIPHIEMFKRL
ncbi:MAG: YbgC/FadM family acyl-CoA thioesterase [Pseudomonadota bacterium]